MMAAGAPSSKPSGSGKDADRIEQETRDLIAGASKQGIVLRLVGGLAVRVHCAENPWNEGRDYGDVDVVTSSGLPQVDAVFRSAGYEPFLRFNALHGHSRAIFYGEDDGLKVDVFLGSFSMCHELPIAERLELDELTVPLAELCLTKLQIVKLNEKDVRDLCALVVEHPVGSSDEETINADRIAAICARDWGLYHTVGLNLGRLREMADSVGLPPSGRDLVRDRVGALLERMEAHEKSRKWRMRARVGERMQWFEEPDEVADAH